MSKHVVVVGAGVIGLTTALTILQRSTPSDPYTVTILAEFQPGDKDGLYTSPWAGAHAVSIVPTEPQRTYERETYGKFVELIEEAKKAGEDKVKDLALALARQVEYLEGEADEKGSVFEKGYQMVRPEEIHPIEKEKLPSWAKKGVEFLTVHIDTKNYLPYLLSQILSLGGTIHRHRLSHVSEAITFPSLSSPPNAIINCTGIGSYNLGGVADTTVFPTRGQTVLVYAPDADYGVTRTGKDDISYVIPRAKSGYVILGGTKQKGVWDTTPDAKTADWIKENAVRMCPELIPSEKRQQGDWRDLEVVEDGCGLRPSREGNIRIELEKVGKDGEEVPLVHHYGHGGFGYQTSWASADRAVKLLRQTLGSA